MRRPDWELQHLMDQVQAAKLSHRQALGGRLDTLQIESTRTELLAALETYGTALEARHLPIPPTLRRDLDMLRRLCAPSQRKRR